MNKQLVMLIASITLFGISSFFRKLAVDVLHPYQLQVVAGCVYALLIPLWLYIAAANNISGWDTAGIVWGVICVVSATVAAVIFGVLLKSSSDPSVIVTLVSMSPVITMALTVLFLGEELTVSKVAATTLTLLGLALFNLG